MAGLVPAIHVGPLRNVGLGLHSRHLDQNGGVMVARVLVKQGPGDRRPLLYKVCVSLAIKEDKLHVANISFRL